MDKFVFVLKLNIVGYITITMICKINITNNIIYVMETKVLNVYLDHLSPIRIHHTNRNNLKFK